MYCTSCGIGYSGACCPTCQPAQSIFQGECQDPGTATLGRFLPVLDYKFCERRLSNAAGFLVSNQNGSGNFGIGFTTTPQVQLGEVEATEDQAFGQLIVMGSDFRWRALSASALAAGLFMQTDASGNVIFGAAPAATVPDPLVVNELTVTTTALVNDLTTNGTVVHNNLSTDTVVNLLGLNAGNEVVLQALTAGIAGSMFFESPASPAAGTPNSAKVNGDYLVIGNRLFDSGANLISVTTSESITVNTAGKYLLIWSAQCRTGGAAAQKAGVWLEINGTIVNYGNGRTGGVTGSNPGASETWQLNGIEMRSLSASDVLKLQLSEVTTGPNIATYEVRLIAVKFSD